MKRILTVVIGAIIVFGTGLAARGEDKATTAILDKAIKALGGEEELSKIKEDQA